MNSKKTTILLAVLLLLITSGFAFSKGNNLNSQNKRVISSPVTKTSSSPISSSSFNPTLFITPTPQPPMECGEYTRIRGRINIAQQKITLIDTSYLGENYCPKAPYESPSAELTLKSNQGATLFSRNIEVALYTPYDYVKENGEFGGGLVEEKNPYFETFIETSLLSQRNILFTITRLDPKLLLGKISL